MGNISLESLELFAGTTAHVSILLTNKELQAWTQLCEKKNWTKRNFARELLEYFLHLNNQVQLTWSDQDDRSYCTDRRLTTSYMSKASWLIHPPDRSSQIFTFQLALCVCSVCSHQLGLSAVLCLARSIRQVYHRLSTVTGIKGDDSGEPKQ